MSRRNLQGLTLLPRRVPPVTKLPNITRVLKACLGNQWQSHPLAQPTVSTAAYEKRRAAILATTASLLTTQEWDWIKARYYHRCAYCRQIKPLTKDHVLPLSKGGQHTKANIIPACKSCNSRKGNRPALSLRSIVCHSRHTPYHKSHTVWPIGHSGLSDVSRIA